MSDRNTGGHHSRTVTLRRLGWLGAVVLLGAALLIPGTAAAAFSSPKCGCSTTSTTSTQTTSTETSDVSETTSTQSTETTETSDVSETTSTQETTTTSEDSGVGGETGTPDVTPPSTSSLPGSSGSSDGWRVILLALAGIAVLSLILLPGDRKRTPR
jgi:cytoskeletal protein RodZ